MSAISIDALVDDLTPVKSLRERDGMSLTMCAAAMAMAFVLYFLGCRTDVLMGDPNYMFFLRGGTLLLLGISTAYAAITMSRPSVGQSNTSWMWVLAAASLFPITAAIMTAIRMPTDMAVVISIFKPQVGIECLSYSALGGLGSGSAMVYWLRRGAPTSPDRAGWLVGIASGSLGATAYSLFCPFNDIYYVGTWYSLAVALCAVIGRIVVPRLIRW